MGYSFFTKFAIFLLPFQEMSRQNVHHLDAAEVFEVSFFDGGGGVAAVVRRSSLAVRNGGSAIDGCCWFPPFAVGRLKDVEFLVDAVDGRCVRSLSPVVVVAVGRRAGALPADGHLHLHARDEVQDGSDASLELGHRRPVRIQMPRLALLCSVYMSSIRAIPAMW